MNRCVSTDILIWREYQTGSPRKPDEVILLVQIETGIFNNKAEIVLVENDRKSTRD